MDKIALTTTLTRLKHVSACSDVYNKLLQRVGLDYPEDQPINLLTVLDSNGVQDMLWCIMAIEQNWEQVKPTVCNMIADFAWDAAWDSTAAARTAGDAELGKLADIIRNYLK